MIYSLTGIGFCYFDDNWDNLQQLRLLIFCHFIWRQLEQLFDNLQLSCCKADVKNTPRSPCCRHIKRKIARFQVVSCCFYCHFLFWQQHRQILKVGSINSLWQILDLFSRINCKLKRERSELRDRWDLRFRPKRKQKMTKRQPNIIVNFYGGNL